MRKPIVATFSIVARDPLNGDLGVAVASKFLAEERLIGATHIDPQVLEYLREKIGAP